MCDTFVALGTATRNRGVIFGKNSDREPNEEQCLEYVPAQDHQSSEAVDCTYLSLPQVSHTHAILISRPSWMWGAEIGANEHGVVIGNEAVFTKMPRTLGKRLTGMDLLRLGLERADTALKALEVIVELLDEYGQGGPCGYQDKKLAYHNSFILADPKEAWILETAGPFWAAKQVHGVYAISNGLTLGSDLDLTHPQLIEHARKKGWLKPGEDFHFARCYSDWFYTNFSACCARRNRSLQNLDKASADMNVLAAFSHLRDHGGHTYRPDRHLLMNRICAHAANPISRHAAQSTASFVAELLPDRQTCWATATSAPCTGLFKPVRFQGEVLPDLKMTLPVDRRNQSVWWNHEYLHRAMLQDFPHRLSLIEAQRDRWEAGMVRYASDTADRDFCSLTKTAFEQAGQLEADWLKTVGEQTINTRNGFIYSKYWKQQNRKAGIQVEDSLKGSRL